MLSGKLLSNRKKHRNTRHKSSFFSFFILIENVYPEAPVINIFSTYDGSNDEKDITCSVKATENSTVFWRSAALELFSNRVKSPLESLCCSVSAACTRPSSDQH